MLNLTKLQRIIVSQRTIVSFSVLILILLITTAVIVTKRMQKNQQSINPPVSTPAITITPTTPLSPTVNQAALSSLIASLPLETASFSLTYDNQTEEFVVVPKITDYNQVRQDLVSWFANKGFTDISSLKITWMPLSGSLPPKRPID